MLDRELCDGFANNFREAVDLATRGVRPQMARALFPNKSRLYARVELSRMFSDGEDSRRLIPEAVDYAVAHGEAEVLIDFVLRRAGLMEELQVVKQSLRRRRLRVHGRQDAGHEGR
jgi:hypothetical protein